MNSEEIHKILQSFIAEGDEDYIGLWEIIISVRLSLGLTHDNLNATDANNLWLGMTEIIELMLHNGFIAVDLVKTGGYKTWDEQDPKQVLTMIKNKWIELKGKSPDVGFIVWFKKR